MCGNNPKLSLAEAEKRERAMAELLDWAIHRPPGPTDWEIADRVRRIFASRAWAERKRHNPGIADLDLLEQVIRYGALWDAVASVE